jgi:hypothetical protein
MSQNRDLSGLMCICISYLFMVIQHILTIMKGDTELPCRLCLNAVHSTHSRSRKYMLSACKFIKEDSLVVLHEDTDNL